MVLRDLIQEKDAHSFTKPVFVYCCGSASSWHPVFTKLVGNIVALSGLKKKLVYIGKEESKVMCVTTGNSALHLSRLSRKWTLKVKVVRKGNGEVGTYRGIVRGVYMQGMLVELDNEVWLMLTDQLLTPPHSLRTGALVSRIILIIRSSSFHLYYFLKSFDLDFLFLLLGFCEKCPFCESKILLDKKNAYTWCLL